MLQIYEIHKIYRYWYYIAIDIYEYVSMYKPSTYILTKVSQTAAQTIIALFHKCFPLQDRDTSNLRDLLAVRSYYTWGHLDTEPVSLTEAESRQRFPAHSSHAWLCGGQVLRSDIPK